MKLLAVVMVGWTTCVAGVAWAEQGAAPAPIDFNVDGKDSTITYHIVHKLHRVDGVSRNVTGRARLQPGGQAQVMVRVAAESFDSGNVNRDEHMKEAVEAARYPMAELKAATDGVTLPTSFPAVVDKTWKAQLSFHGVTQALEVPVKLTFESDRRVTAQATLKVSLDAFRVERPALFFVKIDDQMNVDVRLVFQR